MKKYIILSILFALSLCLHAQTISVSGFRLLESDLTANTAGTMERDQNGDVAALIKVVTTQTGFTFDGGSLGIVKTIQKPSEIWVYVPRGLKKITISHPQLGILRDHYLDIPVEAARTYEMILTTGSVQTIINQDAGGQYLIMNVDPATAIVYVDDNEVSLQNGTLSKLLSYGSHTYRVSDPLYEADAGTFEIGKEKKQIDVKLQPTFGILQISTTPENGAKVFLDNDAEVLGTTPFTTKKLIKGQHKFRFQMPEYESKTITHDVHSDGSTQPLVVQLTPNYANVSINVPAGSSLYINGEDKGIGNWKGRLSEGLYRLEARKKSHVSSSQNLEVKKGDNKELTLSDPTPIYGGINVNSSPIGADIIIDGKKEGVSPDIISQILIGNHKLTLEKGGYSSVNQEINIEEGKILDINITLDEKKNSRQDDIQRYKSPNSSQQNQTNNEDINDKEPPILSKSQLKNDPNGLVKAGRYYFNQNNYEEARSYANKANEAVKPKYSFAPAYLLLGDIESVSGEDLGKAAAFYNQAIYFDPKNPEGYIKWALVYRKISPNQAVAKLQDLKINCPEIDINAIAGHIYMLSGDEKNAYEAYSKGDINKFDETELNEFARSSYFTGHFADALKASEAGVRLMPRNPTFNRLAMFSNYELKNYDAAKNYIHRYFNETDGAIFSEYDYYYSALIYKALNDKENAYKQYDKALELVTDDSMIKRWDILKTISDSYVQDGNFENAIKYYREYLDTKKETTINDWGGLCSLYIKLSDTITDKTQKNAVLIKADAISQEISEKFPDAAEYATYMRANINSKLDPDSKKGLAKPYYEKLAEMLSSKAEKSKSDISMLTTAWHYLMAYNFLQKNDKATAKEYANKILSINPDYAPAQQIRDIK